MSSRSSNISSNIIISSNMNFFTDCDLDAVALLCIGEGGGEHPADAIEKCVGLVHREARRAALAALALLAAVVLLAETVVDVAAIVAVGIVDLPAPEVVARGVEVLADPVLPDVAGRCGPACGVAALDRAVRVDVLLEA